MIKEKNNKTININGEEIKVVNIVNTKQAYQYIKHGLKPVDVCIDETTGKMVFVFDKLKSYELYTKWCNYELN